jgi:rhodanese-related sulfurtransferase
MQGCASEERAGAVPKAHQLLLELNDNHRFLTVEEVADKIINKDPGMLLIDVRQHQEFDAFTLPGAENVPLDSLLTGHPVQRLRCDRYLVVFFSNGDIKAEQAWMLSRRRGCDEVYIMRGGLNQWVQNILMPQPPAATDPAEAFELYQLRRAAAQHFAGQSKALDPEPYVAPPATPAPAAPQPKSIQVKPKPQPAKAEPKEEEGC